MKNNSRVKRILFAVAGRDSGVTHHRLLQLAKSLAAVKYDVDVVTCDEALVEECKGLFDDYPSVRFAHLRQDDRFWTMVQRDAFAKTFIKLNHDLVIPGVDLKFWKMTGFDDFLWNTSSSMFPDITEHYDAVMMPIPSFGEGPSNSCDVFYTHVIFHAKQNGIPVIGLQVFPIYDIPPIFPRLVDHMLVKDDMEKAYYHDLGFTPDRVTVIDDVKDNYCLSTIQDSYRNLTIDNEFEVPRDAIGIVVVNHSRNRSQLYDVLEVIGELDKPKSLFFVLLNYSVKELHEKDIFEDLVQPLLNKNIKTYYTVEQGAMIKSLMLCDVIVATNYIVPLSFAGQYGKCGIVYNPIISEVANIKDVQFVNSRQVLKDALLAQYERKRQITAVADVVREIAPCH